MRIPRKMMPHGGLVTYQPYVGQTATGETWGPEIMPVRARIEDETKLVRTSDGREVTSSSTVWLDPEYTVPADSIITLWKGTPREKTGTVLTSEYLHHPPLPAHVQLSIG